MYSKIGYGLDMSIQAEQVLQLGRVDILLLLSRETLKLLEKLPETEFFLENSVSFLEFYVRELIYVSLLSGYDEMSTEPSNSDT